MKEKKEEKTYHHPSISLRTFKTASFPFSFFPRPFFSPSPSSSTILTQSSSTLFNAMQFIDTILNSVWKSRKTELTRAVLPVPGDPEIYNVEGVVSFPSPSH